MCALPHAQEAVDIDGKTRSLSEYAGKVTLVVNVASACGYTDANYKGACAQKRGATWRDGSGGRPRRGWLPGSRAGVHASLACMLGWSADEAPSPASSSSDRGEGRPGKQPTWGTHAQAPR